MRLWQFLLTLLGLAAVFAVGLLAFNFLVMPRLVHRNQEIRVPSLLDAPLADARESAAAVALVLEVIREEAHPSAPAGTVIDQQPQPGGVIRSGRRIVVVVSGGPPAGPVPDLRGLTPRQAEATLQRETFRLGRTLNLRWSGAVASTVAWQSPAAGTPVDTGHVVDLIVSESSGTPSLLVPDLRGRSLFATRAAVEASGCVLAPAHYRRDSRIPPNTIVEQEPAPGSRILKGETIELVASTR